MGRSSDRIENSMDDDVQLQDDRTETRRRNSWAVGGVIFCLLALVGVFVAMGALSRHMSQVSLDAVPQQSVSVDAADITVASAISSDSDVATRTADVAATTAAESADDAEATTAAPAPPPDDEEQTASEPTEEPEPEATQLAIGSYALDVPTSYGFADQGPTEPVEYAEMIGPDQREVDGQLSPAVVRMTSTRFDTYPPGMGDLHDGLCPTGEQRVDWDHEEAFDVTSSGAPLHFTRDIYVCPDRTYTYAAWVAEGELVVDYFFVGDRGPVSELTDMVKAAHPAN